MFEVGSVYYIMPSSQLQTYVRRYVNKIINPNPRNLRGGLAYILDKATLGGQSVAV